MEQRTAHADARLPAIAGLLWTLLNTLQFAFTLLWTAGCISFALLAQALTGRRDVALRMAAWLWAPGLMVFTGGRFEIEGDDAIDWSKPYLVVANHQSVIDICALFRAVPQPLRFLLKQEMTRVPFVGWYAKACEMLFIVREDRRAGAQMRRDAAAMLSAGRSLCLFPEGTRTRDGRMAPFKAGSLQAAIDAGVPVVPVAIDGAGAVLPVQGFFRVRPGRIRVTLGVPIATTGRDRQSLAAEAQAAVAAMLRG